MSNAATLEVPACRVCGCTDHDACPGGCFWVEGDLCSSCATPKQRERALLEARRRARRRTR